MSGFQARWRELRKDGWTWKRSEGLSNDMIYIKPGKTKKDVRGVDVFVGEKEIMEYLDNVDLGMFLARKQAEGGSASTTTLGGQDDLNTGRTDDLPSHNSVSEAGASDVVPSASVSTAPDDEVNQGINRPRSRSSPLIATSTHIDDRDNSSAEADEEDDESMPDAEGNSSRRCEDEETKDDSNQLSPLDDDPNIISPEDQLDNYTALDSDGDNEGDSVYDDDDDLGPEEPDPVDEDALYSPDLHYEPSLLQRVGGVAAISRGSVDAHVLTDIKFNGWIGPEKETPLPFMDEPYQERPANWMSVDYPNIFTGEGGPTLEAMKAAATALGAFFLFAPPQLWETIAGASDDYFEANLDKRVAAQHAKQEARQRKQPSFQVQSPAEIKEHLENTPEISGREFCVFIGLLIARTIAPNKEKFEHHWKTTDEGAIPRGCFNRFMTRDRFAHLSRNMHFSDNAHRRAATDRAWKLRPVIETLQYTFHRNFVSPSVMAFDEAMLPSRSTFNRMRVFMKDKPHRWGTKLFMLNCSKTAYCIRSPKFRLVVTDRFYTSLVLAMQLLTMNFYTVGTIMMNKRGLCEEILPTTMKNGRRASNKSPAHIPRGTFEVATSKDVPLMKAIRWYDKQGVHVLATGGSAEHDRIVRQDPLTGQDAELMAPRIVKDYQTFMGGVDVHDQLRLQRYSLQLARRYKKYYKSLFLGLIDLAIVNAYIVFNC
uniref:PiggyBac transposable element-derived protein domain-containing protein n=1 Tax=Phytophthora ramorum TaxID=164328 RepID=H3GLY6_PHYRM